MNKHTESGLTFRQVHWLQHKVNEANGRAKRLKQSLLTLAVESEGIKEVSHTVPASIAGTMIDQVYIEEKELFTVVLEGQIPKVNGYSLVAKIEAKTVGNIVSVVPGEHCPTKYMTAHMDCEHCGHNRQRNVCYVLRHEVLGHYIQVGSTCLIDFIGDGNAKALIELASFWGEFNSIAKSEEGEKFSRYEGESMLEFMAYVQMCIRKYGFISKQASSETQTATSFDAWNLMFSKAKDTPRPEKMDYEKAENTLAYFKAMSKEEAKAGGSFLWDLYVLAHEFCIKFNQTGFAAYMPEYLRKEVEKAYKEANPQASESKYLGQVGQKLQAHLRLVKCYSWYNAYGPVRLASFEDKDGNVVVWKTSSGVDLVEGQWVDISGKVKKHELYDKTQTKQTWIERAKIKVG